MNTLKPPRRPPPRYPNGASTTTAYDEFTLALHALRGLDCLVSGAGNIIEPGEFGPLLSIVTDKFTAAHELMREELA